ncbi:UNVERIFIED_CONTAM: hypothetical protein FKN15_059144 [Acipenser sinensis]
MAVLRTEVFLYERAVILISCFLSFLGSCLIIFTYMLWADLRTKPRKLLVFLSVADLLSAVSYFYGVLRDFDSDSWDCVLQGSVSTFANTSSFFWTVAVAIYLYIFIVRSDQRTANGLLLWFHIIRKLTINLVTPAKDLHCIRESMHHPATLSEKEGGGFHIHAALSEYRPILAANPMSQFQSSMADTKLTLIPVIFIALRIWSTIRFVLTLAESPAVQNPMLVILHKLTLVLALAVLISTFGSSFQYGYNVAVVNSPAPVMQEFYNQTYYDRYGNPIEDSYLTLLWSLSVSMFPLGGFFGSLMVAPLVNKLGRKGTLLFNNIFSIVPAVLMGASEAAKSYEIIIAARFLVGICAGLSSSVVPMYLGEISPKNLRGAIGIVPELFITIGILMAQIFGIRSILGNTRGWTLMLALTGIPAVIELVFLPFFPESPRYMLIQKGDEEKAKKGWTLMLALTGIPAVIELVFLPFFPESPRYMLIQKGDEEKARKALQRLRGWEDVDSEMEEMRLEEQSEKAEGCLSVLNLCSFPSLRWQLISITVMNMGQQLSGVNAVVFFQIYYYADSIYGSAGVKESAVQYVTVGTGSVNVFMTIAAVFIVEASGRKLLLLIGFGICGAACVVLTIALTLQVLKTFPGMECRVSNFQMISMNTGFIINIKTAMGWNH